MLPRFETERLWLRPRTMADFAACLDMDRDPEVTKFVPGPWTDPEAARPVAEHALLTFGLDRIVADIAPRNQASMRVAEKIGMVFASDGTRGADPLKRFVMTKADLPEPSSVRTRRR